MIPASRTPEGDPNRCPICGSAIRIDPSRPTDDAPCPNCGHLLWFVDAGDPESDALIASFLESGDRGSETIDQVRRNLHRIVGDAKHKKLLLNFRAVAFLSSAMISQLIMLNKSCKAQGVKLTFCEVSPNVMEVFRITKLSRQFDFEESED